MSGKPKVFLIPHRDPRGGHPSPRELRALREIGRRLRGESIAHAVHVACAPAQVTLQHLLEGARLPVSMMRPLEVREGKSEIPCCEDAELATLLRRVPRRVRRPDARTLLELNAQSAAMVAARTIWRVEEWLHGHRGPGIMVIHPLALELAMWSLTGFVSYGRDRDPRVFSLELQVSRRVATLPPGRVVRVPYNPRFR